MGNGSVLHYLKKERGTLVSPDNADCSVVCIHKSNRSLLVEWLPETFLPIYLYSWFGDSYLHGLTDERAITSGGITIFRAIISGERV